MEVLILNYLHAVAPLIAGVLGLILTWYILPIIISISHAKHLVDEPVGVRKLHSNVTPNLGGVAFYFSLLVVFVFSGYANMVWTPYLLGSLTLLFFSGVKDDILIISARRKLVLQIIAVLALIVGGDVVITDMGGVFGFTDITYWSGVLLTAFTMIVVINAYNLIDGIDGLAGCIGLLVSLLLGSWFWYTGYISHAILSFTCVGVLGAFLRYNFQPASVFMGDTGSQVIGFLLGFLAVSFVQLGVTSANLVPFQEILPVLVISILIVPLYDTLRVFTMRTIKNGSPFSPDRLHVHHQLLDFGFSDQVTCVIILGMNIFLIGVTLVFSGIEINALLGIVLLTSGILFPTAGIKRYLIKKMGFSMPSVRQIHVLERMYGVKKRSVGSKKKSEGMKKRERELENKLESLVS